MRKFKYLFLLVILLPSLAWSQQPMGGDTIQLRGNTIRMKEVPTPSTPLTSYDILYFKSDHKLYMKDSTGTESQVGTGAGNGGNYTFIYSITNSANNVYLSGDSASPGSYRYYGTAANNAKAFQTIPSVRAPVFTIPGNLTVANNVAPMVILPYSGTFNAAYAAVGTAPVGNSLQFLVRLCNAPNSGCTNLWAANNGLAIANNAYVGNTTTFSGASTFTSGQLLQIDCTQIGASTAGSDATVVIETVTIPGISGGGGGGNMVYPGAGIANSTGAAWGNSITTPFPVTIGGTGGSSAATARAGIGAAASNANSDITSLSGLTTPLSVPQGGTGGSSWTQYSIPVWATSTVLGYIPIGDPNYYLRVNAGATGYTWSAGTGTTNPGGSDQAIQFNYGGAFGGSNSLTWDYTNSRLKILGNVGIGATPLTATPLYIYNNPSTALIGQASGLKIMIDSSDAMNNPAAGDFVGIYSAINSENGRDRIWAMNPIAGAASGYDATVWAMEVNINNEGSNASDRGTYHKIGVDIVSGGSTYPGTIALGIDTARTGGGWRKGLVIAGVTDDAIYIRANSIVGGVNANYGIRMDQAFGVAAIDLGGNPIISSGDYLLNNNAVLRGKNIAGTAKALTFVGTDDNMYFGFTQASGKYLIIGNNSVENNPVLIRVGGGNSRQVLVGDPDSGGTGYSMLRVPN